MNKKIDVVVIGGGPGGTPAAINLANRGKRVLLVEKTGKLGGACLFVGCIPSKIVKHFADTYKEKGSLSEKWKSIRNRIEVILKNRSDAAISKINTIPNATFIAGTGSFLSDHEVLIKKNTGEEEIYSFENAIISTGAVSFIPPFKGNGIEDILTSEKFFNLDKLPESLLIIGGGPIGVELAQMLTKLGVKCSIVELLDTILYKIVDPEFVDNLTDKLLTSGISIYTSSKVIQIDKASSGFDTTFLLPNGEKKHMESEQVLVVTGKIPNIKNLNLEATPIKYDRNGIVTNEFLETTAPGIYATGDVIHGPKFAHMATYEAINASMNILMGNKNKMDFDKNAWVLFSDPEIASVGYNEEKAREMGYDVIVGKYDYKIDAASQVRNEPFGYLKFVVDRKTLRVLGIHIFVNGASSLIGEATLIVANKLTLKDISKAIHPHPTLTEAFGILAGDMISELPIF